MRNIVLARVDERLIHGQVITSWLKLCDVNAIVIIDDASATNAFLKRILFAAAPKNIALQVLTEAEAADYLKQDAPAGERVLLLAKTPGPMLKTIKSGIELKEITLGNMSGAAGRKRFNKNIFATEQEVQDFRDIVASGTDIYCQMVPSDAKDDIKKLLV